MSAVGIASRGWAIRGNRVGRASAADSRGVLRLAADPVAVSVEAVDVLAVDVHGPVHVFRAGRRAPRPVASGDDV